MTQAPQGQATIVQAMFNIRTMEADGGKFIVFTTGSNKPVICDTLEAVKTLFADKVAGLITAYEADLDVKFGV